MNNSVCIFLDFKNIFVYRAVTERPMIMGSFIYIITAQKKSLWSFNVFQWVMVFFPMFSDLCSFPYSPISDKFASKPQKNHSCVCWSGTQRMKVTVSMRIFKGGKISSLLSTYNQILRDFRNESCHLLFGKYFRMIKNRKVMETSPRSAELYVLLLHCSITNEMTHKSRWMHDRE